MQSFKLSDIFQDHMVFQRDQAMCFFGESFRKQTLIIHLLEQTFSFEIDQGRFQVEIPKQEVRQPFTIQLQTNTDSITLEDCVLGDVFFLGGQSNMEFLVSQAIHVEVIESDRLRYFHVPKLPYEGAEVEFPEYYQNNPTWKKATKENIAWMSALGYMVAMKLLAKHDTYIALIGCNFGGTSVLSWIDQQTIYQYQGLSRLLNNYQFEVEKYESMDTYNQLYHHQAPKLRQFYQAIERGVQAGLEASMAHEIAYQEVPNPYLPYGPKHENRPCGLYETMVKRVVPFPLKAFLYYQGESDHEMARYYQTAMTALIDSWRRSFQNSNIPFYYVQIAAYDYPGAKSGAVPNVRLAQAKLHDPEKKQIMVTAIDLGHADDIHPKDKCVLAQRLVDVVEEFSYDGGKSNYAISPKQAILQDNHVVLTFEEARSYKPKLDSHLGFEGSVDGKVFTPVKEVRVQGSELHIYTESPLQLIRYLYENAPICNFYDEFGGPLLPFSLVVKRG